MFMPGDIVKLTEKDITAIMTLQTKVINWYNQPDKWKPLSEREFRNMLSDKTSVCLGIRSQEDQNFLLACIFGYRNDCDTQRRLLSKIGCKDSEILYLDLTIEDMEFWSAKTQGAMGVAFEDEARKKKYKYIWSTVHPQDTHFLEMFSRCKYQHIASGVVIDGATRDIYLKKL